MGWPLAPGSNFSRDQETPTSAEDARVKQKERKPKQVPANAERKLNGDIQEK
jgi:hypothetical protein